ncbi:MAG: class I SAM-dependent methyltransferase [Phycisphaerae bacterium]|nr:class I SAM-dependent methyltransferase [Phycisphaerae bacterium]
MRTETGAKALTPEQMDLLDSGESRALPLLRPLMNGLYRQWRPPGYQEHDVVTQADRQAMQLDWVLRAVGRKAVICDIGGGWGHFAAGCSLLGMRAINIDQMPPQDGDDPRVQMSRQYGFELRICDVCLHPLGLSPESLDVVTSFDCIEHLHHSPKGAYTEAMRALRPGGLFFLGAPNCVNLRKRITALLGRAKWSSMKTWYETTPFLAHVREPDVDDLYYIARDLGLTRVKVFGRNWCGLRHQNPLVRGLARLADSPLRLRPSLCSDIYLVGIKPM